MEKIEVALVKKVFTLIFLSVLLYVAFLATNSLAVLSDSLYSLTDALYVFALWLAVVVISRDVLSSLSLRMISLSVTILSLVLVFAASFLIYSSVLALNGHAVIHPEVVVAAELLFVFLLFYVYISFREEAVEENVHALIAISRDVERNILGSVLVIVAALFAMVGLQEFDAVVAFFISAYVLYRNLLLSYRSFRASLGVSDPVLHDVVRERIMSGGARLKKLTILGIGPFYYVEAVVDVSHLPDEEDKVFDHLRRRIEAVLPSTAKIVLKSPGGGI